MKKTLIIAAACFGLCGCESLDKLGNAIYSPVTSTNTVETAEGPVAVVSTNGWTLKTGIRSGVQLAGDVAPFPWAGLVANGIIAALGVGAALRSRKWKQAAASGVHAAQVFKRELQLHNAAKTKEIKTGIVLEQKTRGTQTLIQNLLNSLN